MDPKQRYQENLQLFHDAVRMKKTSRVPLSSSDAFWRYYDAGYKLSEAVSDYKKMEDAALRYVLKYQIDCLGDYGARNPLQVTTKLGNEEYIFDDVNNTLVIKEQECFMADEYDSYIANPTKTIWEKIMPRKYKKFTPDVTADNMVEFLGEFLKYNMAMQRISNTLKNKGGAVPIVSGSLVSVVPPIEVLVNFYRGFRGMGKDMRKIPDKVQAFLDSQWDVKGLESIKPMDQSDACFSANIPILSPNLMSKKQCEQYLWPHLKQIADYTEKVDGAVMLLTEGTTMHITEYLQELPKGHFCIYVESDDIFERRKALPNLCLCGGIPVTLWVREPRNSASIM